MLSQSLAKRYVGAAFSLAVEQRVLQQAEAQLLAVQEALAASAEFARFLSHPRIAHADKQAMIQAALGEEPLPVVSSFVGQLLAHRRIEVLTAAGTVFQALADEFAGRARAQVRTAAPLTAGQSARLAAALTKLVGRPVTLDAEVDPEVIGGVSVRIGDDTMDGTLRSGLMKLTEKLSGG
jgi:F-type H+-transporting ATPase subunit delta